MKVESNTSNHQPIRIAHIIGNWFGGGVEAVVMNYYRHIDRTRIQFDFLCSENSTNIPYDEIEDLGGRVYLIPNYTKISKYQKELIKIFKENKYKIVHSHINTLSVFSLHAAKKAGVPVRIAHSHSTTNKAEWKKNIIKQCLRPFSKIYATDYFACSELAGRWLFGNKTYNDGKVYILNNAIDVDKFDFNEEIRKKKRKELNIEDGTLVIGHVGRFVAQKNHKKLIEIFNEVHKQNRDTILLLAGQGPLMDKIKKQVNESGLKNSVIFLGQRSDINELYQAFDVFVLPSLYEGLGIVLIEAQCSGLYCISSREVPVIAQLTNLVEFVDLKMSKDKWATQILNNCTHNKREKHSREISNKGYNIFDNAKILQKKYYLLQKK
jgi:glycosyltransferase involved in cell wall biosynthesis